MQTPPSRTAVGKEAGCALAQLPPSVRAATGRLLALLDARFPSRVEAFYLVGSVALGDYQEGRSDVDFVAVLAAPSDRVALGAIHAEVARWHPGLDCDGIYLRPGELSAPPAGTGVEIRASRVYPQSAGERHAVTWQTLADTGIALRGRAPDSRWIAVGRDATIRHSRDNLNSYWRNWLETRRSLISPAGVSLLSGAPVAWGCLGIARLQATIATGRTLSKSSAGDHALAVFPQHARLVSEALRLRRQPSAPSYYQWPLARRRDLLAFMDAVLADSAR